MFIISCFYCAYVEYITRMTRTFHTLLCCVMVRFTLTMMTSSNGNIFRVTGPLCGEFTGPGEFPTQRPVTRSFDVFFDLRLNKRLGKQSWGWWFETLSRSLWRHRNAIPVKQSFTHWDRNKMDAISQMTHTTAFSWMKTYEFRLRFHWSLLLRFESTILQHWFR